MPSRRTLLVFQFGGQACALPVEDVLEIVPMALVGRPPGLVSFVEGFLNLRGTAVAVLRPDLLFRLPPKAPELYTPLIIVRGTGCPLASMAERVDQIASVPAEA